MAFKGRVLNNSPFLNSPVGEKKTPPPLINIKTFNLRQFTFFKY